MTHVFILRDPVAISLFEEIINSVDFYNYIIEEVGGEDGTPWWPRITAYIDIPDTLMTHPRDTFPEHQRVKIKFDNYYAIVRHGEKIKFISVEHHR